MNTKHTVRRYMGLMLLAPVVLGLETVNTKLIWAADGVVPPPSMVAAVSKKVVGKPAKAPKVKKGPQVIKAEVTTTPAEPQGEPIFAVVNGKSIPLREYNATLANVMRQRFYHGSIPEDKAAAVYKEVADSLIERELLADEAERRGIRPDIAPFEKAVAETDARYSKDPGWPAEREKMLPELKAQLTRQSIIERLQKSIRDMPEPTLTETRAYYEKKPELFTEPAKLRLRVILLKVDPTSPKEGWDKAHEEAEEIYNRIKGGADFAKEARLHSTHDSAANGGDMGYLHGGMLPQTLQTYIDKLKVGELTEPIRMLEGYGIYRLDDLIPAKLQEFSAVKERAQGLLKREWADQAWQETISRLRAAAQIKIITPPNVGVAGKSNNSK